MRFPKAWLFALGIAAGLALVAVGAALYFYLSPERAVRRALQFERALAGLARKETELPGGLRYAYLEGGKGEPLMLLHGFGANKDNFVRVAKYLTPHYRVIIPDHIGFGESSKPDKADYSPRAQAERLRALAKELGIPKAASRRQLHGRPHRADLCRALPEGSGEPVAARARRRVERAAERDAQAHRDARAATR